MPLDGITLNSVVQELSLTLEGGRVDKIGQPESDEIIMAVRSRGKNYKLLLTSGASSPRIHLTEIVKSNPAQAPMFCMLLRKHLGGGRIVKIIQPDFERIVEMHIESPNEMGDLSVKRLIIEIMGKHSNIILVDAFDKIMDSIRHIPRELSSVREVLPGRIYVRPPARGKIPPVPTDKAHFLSLFEQNKEAYQIIYQSYNGISPVVGSEICLRAGVAPNTFAKTLSDEEKERLFSAFCALYADAGQNRFKCRIYEEERDIKRDFSAINLSVYTVEGAAFTSPSEMLEVYYRRQDNTYRLRQKTADLRKIVQNHFERCRRKEQMFEENLLEIENRDRLRHYGELLTAFIYSIPPGADKTVVPDFYNENEDVKVEIPLDPACTPAENAQKYFKSYNKAKRAYKAIHEQKTANSEDMAYLDSVLTAISSVTNEDDIAEIRAELAETGFLKKRQQKGKKAQKKKFAPLHYRSTEGFDIFVGKNNTQNDELTLRFAASADIWLHTKEIAGSHVIIQKAGREITTRAVMEGAMLAAYHSKGRMSSRVPVDFCPRKNVRKPKGAKPGFVIYDFYNTVYVTPKEDEVEKMEVTE